MKLIRALEPLWWMLFGAGGFMAAFFLPALLFVLAFAFPLGWFGDSTETFLRFKQLFANAIGKTLLILVISLTFWHAVHHLRHFAIDLGFQDVQGPVSHLLYGGALVGTLASIAIIGAL